MYTPTLVAPIAGWHSPFPIGKWSTSMVDFQPPAMLDYKFSYKRSAGSESVQPKTVPCACWYGPKIPLAPHVTTFREKKVETWFFPTKYVHCFNLDHRIMIHLDQILTQLSLTTGRVASTSGGMPYTMRGTCPVAQGVRPCRCQTDMVTL